MEKEQLLKYFKNYCEKICETDKIAILHHADTDGFCSALLANKTIELIRGKAANKIINYHYNEEPFQNLVDSLKQEKINKLIIVDLNLDQVPNEVKRVEEFAEILMIDHHKVYNDLSSKKTVFLKASFFNEIDSSRYAAAKFSFDLFNKIVDLKNFEWIACVGIFGDMVFEAWEEFIEDCEKKFSLSFQDFENLKNLIEAVAILKREKLGELFAEFYSAKNPKDLLKSDFMKYVDSLEKEISFFEQGFERNAEYFPELNFYFYQIKSKHHLKSFLINRLSLKHPNKTIVVVQELLGKVKISARRQDFKVKMNELLEKATKDIPKASAGGHIPAAAGSIPLEYLEKFKKNLIEVLSEKNKH